MSLLRFVGINIEIISRHPEVFAPKKTYVSIRVFPLFLILIFSSFSVLRTALTMQHTLTMRVDRPQRNLSAFHSVSCVCGIFVMRLSSSYYLVFRGKKIRFYKRNGGPYQTAFCYPHYDHIRLIPRYPLNVPILSIKYKFLLLIGWRADVPFDSLLGWECLLPIYQ